MLTIWKTWFFHPGRMSSRGAAFLEMRLMWPQSNGFLSGLIIPINVLIPRSLLVMPLRDGLTKKCLIPISQWTTTKVSLCLTPSPPLFLPEGGKEVFVLFIVLLLHICPLQWLLPLSLPPPSGLPLTPTQEELHVATGETLMWLMAVPRALERRIEAKTGKKLEAGWFSRSWLPFYS